MNESITLTPKQESFCVRYTTIGTKAFGNGTKSVITAGYGEKSAYSQTSALLKNPKIQQRIKELMVRRLEGRFITSALTKKRLFKYVCIGQLIYMVVKRIYRNQQKII
jgi:phage terminase small subunit